MARPPAPSRTLRVLVADDDDDMRALVVSELQAVGCATTEAKDGDEVVSLLREALDDPSLLPDVIVTDVKMPHLSGFGILAALRGAGLRLPVLVITGMNDPSIQVVASRLGAIGVLQKPFDPEELVTAVRRAADAHHP